MTMFDPFADLTRLRQQIGRMVDEAAPAPQRREESRVWRPSVDVFEDSDAFTLKLDLPEIDNSTLDVQLTGEELVIRGERKPSLPAGGTLVHAERPHGRFQRAFRLGVPLQHDAVQATYREGVLTVRLPKAETVKPRKVAVQIEAEQGQA